MIGHVTLGGNDFEKAKNSYDTRTATSRATSMPVEA
jgi:hypothetical protein